MEPRCSGKNDIQFTFFSIRGTVYVTKGYQLCFRVKSTLISHVEAINWVKIFLKYYFYNVSIVAIWLMYSVDLLSVLWVALQCCRSSMCFGLLLYLDGAYWYSKNEIRLFTVRPLNVGQWNFPKHSFCAIHIWHFGEILKGTNCTPKVYIDYATKLQEETIFTK